MASTRYIIFIAVIVATFATFISGKEIVVGDDAGWKLHFDYQTWAAGKEFIVGDTLVFKYSVGSHNVFKVNGTGFQQCSKPALTEALATGNDVITLATPGRKWYICGIGSHCSSGNMKLFINVLDQSAPAPAPAPIPSAASGMKAFAYRGFVAALIFGLLFLVIVV